jgi:serine/threonine protein kinase/Tfp pilus assembly protein PilF
MEPGRWRRITEIYHAAIEHGPQKRASYLGEACNGDEALRSQVEAMIKSHERSGDFIELPAFSVAPELLLEEPVGALAGELIGHYRVESLIGVGGMGEVYLARDERLERKVALKIIKIDLVKRSVEAHERFMREACAAAALRHKNIATVYQFGIREETGQYFYAMELIEGETLDQRVRRAGPLDVRTTIDIAQQATSALAAAEKLGLVHRDLKPDNLMLVPPEGETAGATSNNEQVVVKIIDFGLAKALRAPVNPMSLTQSGFVGTPEFASPEQFEHSGLDVRSDIYSLGVTLWFALTGRTPFVGHRVEEIHEAQKSDALPIEQLKAARVPSRLRSLLTSMLALEPASRPSTHDLAARLQHCAIQASGTPPTRVALAAAVILVLGVSAMFIFWALRTQNLASNPAASEKSIAALPFESRSEDKANAYFAEGIQDEILTRLSKIADLKVISRTSTQRYKSAPVSLTEIAKQLGVAHILEGGVQKSGDTVRVNVKLINAENNSYVWSDSYDRKLTDIFAVETDIAKRIADSLKATLTRSERQALNVQPTANPEAYKLYLQGRFFWNKRTGADLRKAIDYFNDAIAKDPNYALAYAGLADCYDLLDEYSELSPKESYPKAKAAAIKALELDDTLGEAHTSLAYSLMNYDWDWRSAQREYQRAIQLNPNYATAHQWYSECLSILGSHVEAIAEIKKARQLDPLSLIINQGVGGKYLYARRYDEAIAQFHRTLELYPHFPPTHQRLGWCYAQKGMYDEAIAEMQKAVELSENSTQMIAALGYAYAAAGRRNAAQGIIGELERRSKESYVDPYVVATIFAALGEMDEAFALLDKACAEHSYWMPYINTDFQLDNLRSDSRFDALMRRVFTLKQ